MDEDKSLNSREWQLFLVLKELQGQLTEKEKNQKLSEWIEEKTKEPAARSGW